MNAPGAILAPATSNHVGHSAVKLIINDPQFPADGCPNLPDRYVGGPAVASFLAVLVENLKSVIAPFISCTPLDRQTALLQLAIRRPPKTQSIWARCVIGEGSES